MAEVCRFDDSLPRLVKLLVDKLGRERISAGVVLRDATGRLSFFSDAALEPTPAREIEQLAGAALGVYARPERVVVGATDPGAERPFADWDPVSNPDKLVESYYARTFETLIAYVDDLVSVEQRDAQD